MIGRRLPAARPSPSPIRATSSVESQPIGTIPIEKTSLITLNPQRVDERFQNADDPSTGAKKKKTPQEGKGREIRLEVITIQSSPKAKVKSFGVASECLVTEHVDISPVNSPEIRSASPSPKLFRRTKANQLAVKHESKKDFRDWVKDQVHLKIASLKRSISGSGSTSGDPDAATASAAMDPLDFDPCLPQVMVTPAEATAPCDYSMCSAEQTQDLSASFAAVQIASPKPPKKMRSPPPHPPWQADLN